MPALSFHQPKMARGQPYSSRSRVHQLDFLMNRKVAPESAELQLQQHPPELSAASRRGLWCFILTIQLANAAVLTTLGVIYATVEVRDSLLWYLRSKFLYSKEQHFLTQAYRYVSAGYLLLAGCFWFEVATMLWHSIWHRKLCYGIHMSSLPSMPSRCARHNSCALHWFAYLLQAIYRMYQRLGVRGPYFSAGFLIKEILESVLQTIQAYRSSQCLSSTDVNHSYAALIFLNCFACGVIDYLFRHHPILQRLLSVIVDLSLHFVWGSVIPYVIAWPYFQVYGARFQLGVFQMNVWQEELEYLLVMSTSSFVLSVFPFLSSLMNTRNIKRLLSYGMLPKRRESMTKGPLAALCEVNPPPIPVSRSVLLKVRQRLTSRSNVWERCTSIGQILLPFYGIGIVVVATSARYSNATSAIVGINCSHRVYPWFASGMICSQITMNCSQMGIRGRLHELEPILKSVNGDLLISLEFAECSELEMPSQIRQFSKLSIVKIRESNVLSWDEEAALTNDAFPDLLTLRFDSVYFDSVPYGFVRLPLPSSFEFIRMDGVNANIFVEKAGPNWSRLKYFYCDNCNLSSVPAVVETMTELQELSLCSNEIESFDGDWLTKVLHLENIWLDACPVSELPEKLWLFTSHMQDFSIQLTNISAIPAIVDTIARKTLRIYGLGSPLCTKGETSSTQSHLVCNEMPY